MIALNLDKQWIKLRPGQNLDEEWIWINCWLNHILSEVYPSPLNVQYWSKVYNIFGFTDGISIIYPKFVQFCTLSKVCPKFRSNICPRFIWRLSRHGINFGWIYPRFIHCSSSLKCLDKSATMLGQLVDKYLILWNLVGYWMDNLWIWIMDG